MENKDGTLKTNLIEKRKERKMEEKRSRRSRSWIPLLVGLGVLLLLVVGAFLWQQKKAAPVTQEQPPAQVPTSVPQPVVQAPATKIATVQTPQCVNPDELIQRLNDAHAKDANNVRPVLRWLESLVGRQIKTGRTIVNSPESNVFWTTKDISPKRFIRTTTQGVIVAYMGGSKGTIFGLYDGDWITPVDGTVAPMCFRLNPAGDLNYWGK